jgi:tRNA-Thr(GGU) m(6)t(6)A37 methyltransferase TsaA
MQSHYIIQPVGVVHKTEAAARLEIYPPYRQALLGLEGFSHLQVLYWFHENDNPAGRGFLQVHPRRDAANPLTGVFATHSPLRPNLVGSTICRVLSVAMAEGAVLIEAIDARDGSPVVDLKCYIPPGDLGPVRVPSWV